MDQLSYLLPDLGWRDGMRLEDVFQPDSDTFAAVVDLIGTENADIARQLWMRESAFPYGLDVRYPIGYMQTFRTTCFGSLHYDRAVANLHMFIGMTMNGRLSLPALIEKPDTPILDAAGTDDFPANILGFLLDTHADWKRLLDRIEQIVAERRESARRQGDQFHVRDMTRALCASNRPEAHRLVANWINDPNTTESERAAHLEYVNKGTAAAFRHIITFMRDGLMVLLYPSVLDAMAYWFGLSLDTLRVPDWHDIVFFSGGDYLNNNDAWRKALDNTKEWPLTFHLCLCAAALEGVEQVLDISRDLLANGTYSQRLAVLHFCRRLCNLTFQARVASWALADEDNRSDPAIAGLALRCLREVFIPMSGSWQLFSSLGVRLTDQPDAHPKETDDSYNIVANQEEVDELFTRLEVTGKALFTENVSDRGAWVVAGDRFAVAVSRSELMETIQHYQTAVRSK